MHGARTRTEQRIAALIGDQRGAAMIEAVIVLPVLLMLFAGALFLRDRYLGKQHALLEARRCAWVHAIGGCGKPPDGCAATVAKPSADDPDAVAIMSATRARSASDIDVLDDIPILGAAIAGLFGTQTGATAEVAIPLPWRSKELRAGAATTWVGAARAASVPFPVVTERAEVVVLCNEQPRDVLQAAKDVFCKHVPRVFCD